MRTMPFRLGRLTACALLAIAVIGAACSGGDDEDADGGDVTGPLSFTLTLASDTVDAGGAIPLTVTLTNESDDALVVARPAIVPAMVFLEVTRDGETVPFDGPWPRLRPLGQDAFVELGPGEHAEHEFDLAAFYTLEPGSYRVTAHYRNPQDGSHLGLSALVIAPADEIASDAATLEVR